MRVGFVIFLLSALSSGLMGQVQIQHCKEVPVTTKTRWGGNETVEIIVRRPVRTVNGMVFGPGVGSIPTLVEVLPRNPSESHSPSAAQSDAVPIAACETGDDGAFAFSLPPGEYRLRMSQNSGVDVTLVDVSVQRGWHRSRKIRVAMHVGT